MYQLLCAGHTPGVKIQCVVIKEQMEREFGVPLDDVIVKQKWLECIAAEVTTQGEGQLSDSLGIRAMVMEPVGSEYYTSCSLEEEDERTLSLQNLPP